MSFNKFQVRNRYQNIKKKGPVNVDGEASNKFN